MLSTHITVQCDDNRDKARNLLSKNIQAISLYLFEFCAHIISGHTSIINVKRRSKKKYIYIYKNLFFGSIDWWLIM